MLKKLDFSTHVILFGLLGATLMYDFGVSAVLSVMVFLILLAISIAMFVVGVRKEREEFDLFGDGGIVYNRTLADAKPPIREVAVEFGANDYTEPVKENASTLTDSDMDLFNNEMGSISKNLRTIDAAMQKSDTINNIMNKKDRWLALSIFHDSLAKSPERLTDISGFAYTNLPDLAKLVKLHVTFEDEKIVDDNMIKALDESAIAIARLADLLVDNYIDFREKELNELKSHVNNVNQLVDKHERFDGSR